MKFNMTLPLLGFEDVKEVELRKIDDIFMKMQSLNNKNISFTMVNPFVLREYDFEVPDKTKDLLQIDENSNLLILNIVVIQTPIEDSLVNFIGPVVFNTDTKQAAQIIINDNPKYCVAEKISTFFKS